MEPLSNPLIEVFADLRQRHPLAMDTRAQLRVGNWFRMEYVVTATLLCFVIAVFESRLRETFPYYSLTLTLLGMILHMAFGKRIQLQMRREASSLRSVVTSGKEAQIAQLLREYHRQPRPAEFLAAIPAAKTWLVDKPEQYASELLDDDIDVRVAALCKVLDPHGPGWSRDIQRVNDLQRQYETDAERRQRTENLLRGSEQSRPSSSTGAFVE